MCLLIEGCAFCVNCYEVVDHFYGISIYPILDCWDVLMFFFPSLKEFKFSLSFHFTFAYLLFLLACWRYYIIVFNWKPVHFSRLLHIC